MCHQCKINTNTCIMDPSQNSENMDKVEIIKDKINNLSTTITMPNTVFSNHPSDDQLSKLLDDLRSMDSQERSRCLKEYLDKYNNDIHKKNIPNKLMTISDASIKREIDILNNDIKKLLIE